MYMRCGKWNVITGQSPWPWIILKWISKEYDGETSIWITTVASSAVSKYFDEIFVLHKVGSFLS